MRKIAYYLAAIFSIVFATSVSADPIQMTFVGQRTPISLDGGPITTVDLVVTFMADTTNLLPVGGWNDSKRYPNLVAVVSSTALNYYNVPATNPLNVDIGNVDPFVPNSVAIVSTTLSTAVGMAADPIGSWDGKTPIGPLTASSLFCDNCNQLKFLLSNGHTIRIPLYIGSFSSSLPSPTFQAQAVTAAAPIPTVTEWGLIAFATLLGALLLHSLRQRKL